MPTQADILIDEIFGKPSPAEEEKEVSEFRGAGAGRSWGPEEPESPLERATEKAESVFEYDPVAAPVRAAARVIGKQTGYEVEGALESLYTGAIQTPSLAVSRAISAVEGAERADVVSPDIAQRLAQAIQDEDRARQQEIIDKYGDKLVAPGIKLSDVGQLPQNLAYSLVSAGAGIGAGLVTAKATAATGVGAPAAPYTGWTAGVAAAGKTAFEMAENEIMTQYLQVMQQAQLMGQKDIWQEELPKGLIDFRPGQSLTEDQQKILKEHFDAKATEYGLWEAGPEVISQAVTLGVGGVLASPLKNVVSRGVAAKLAIGLGGIGAAFGTEQATETITQMAQKRALYGTPLAEGPRPDWMSIEDWMQAGKEVAPQTAMLTAVLLPLAAGGQSAYQANDAQVAKMIQNAVKENKLDVLPDEAFGQIIDTAHELVKIKPDDAGLVNAVAVLEKEARRRLDIIEKRGQADQKAVAEEAAARTILENVRTRTEALARGDLKVEQVAAEDRPAISAKIDSKIMALQRTLGLIEQKPIADPRTATQENFNRYLELRDQLAEKEVVAPGPDLIEAAAARHDIADYQSEYMQKRIKDLGGIEEVNKAYKTDSQLDKFAREIAPSLLEVQEEAEFAIPPVAPPPSEISLVEEGAMEAAAPGGPFMYEDESAFRKVSTDLQQSKEFNEWGGGETIVKHDDGSPRVVFHGDKLADLEYFDMGYASEGNRHAKGFYATMDPGNAENYGKNIYPVVLKLKNPLNMTEYISKKETVSWIDGFRKHTKILSPKDINRLKANINKLRSEGVEINKENIYQTMAEMRSGMKGIKIKEELNQYIQALGHDGLTLGKGTMSAPTTYVAFNADQIWSVAKNRPWTKEHLKKGERHVPISDTAREAEGRRAGVVGEGPPVVREEPPGAVPEAPGVPIGTVPAPEPTGVSRREGAEAERGYGEAQEVPEVPGEKAKPTDIRRPASVSPDLEKLSIKKITGEAPVPSGKSRLFDGFDLPAEKTHELVRRKIQDYILRQKKVQIAIEKAGGKIKESRDAYLAEELFYGKTKDGLREFEETLIDPLLDTIKDKKLAVEDVELYLYAKHAPERNERIAEINPHFREKGIPGSGMSNEKAQEILDRFAKEGVADSLDEVARKVYAINNARLKLLKESGLVSEEELSAWKGRWKFYVPLKGLEGKKDILRVGKGYDIRGKESRRALGRRSLAKDILMHSIAQMEESIVRVEKNKVGQTFLGLAREFPNDKLWEINKVVYKPRFDVKSGEVRYGPDPRYKLADNVLSVKEDGKEYHITIHDDALARAMKNLGAERSGKVLGILHTFNRFLATVNTAMNPEFVISNFVRDIQTATINIAGEQSAGAAKNVVKNTPIALKGAYSVIRNPKAKGEWADWFREYRTEGGMVGFFGFETIEQKRKKVLKRLKEAKGGRAAWAKKFAKEIVEFVMDINMAVENGVRLSAYASLRKAGVSKAKAASIAKNLTVNFNRKGELGTIANSLYLFYNAGIQGTFRMFTALKSPRVRKIVSGVVAGSFLLTELNRMTAGEDDDGENHYDKIDDWIKEHNLIIMKADGNYYKLPLPYGYNIFHVAGATISDAVHGKNPTEAAVHLLKASLDAFNPLGGEESPNKWNYLLKLASPTIIDPILQWGLNENFYGAPLRPEQSPYGLKKPQSQLYWSTVSPTSKKLASELNRLTGGSEVRPGKVDISPEALDHIFNFYTGGAGRFLKQSFDHVVNLAKGDDTPLYKTPFKRRLVGEPSEYYTPRKYRENIDEIKLIAAELESIASKDRQAAAKFVRNNRQALALYLTTAQINDIIAGRDKRRLTKTGYKPFLKKVEKDIGNIEAKIKKVEKSGFLTDAHKKARIETMEKQIEAAKKKFNKRYNELKGGR